MPPFLFRLLAVKVPEDRSSDFWRLASPAPSSATASRLLRKLSTPLPTPPGTLVELSSVRLPVGISSCGRLFPCWRALRGRDFGFRGEDWVLSSGFAGTFDSGGPLQTSFSAVRLRQPSLRGCPGIEMCLCVFFLFFDFCVFWT